MRDETQVTGTSCMSDHYGFPYTLVRPRALHAFSEKLRDITHHNAVFSNLIFFVARFHLCPKSGLMRDHQLSKYR